jgi:hypothetical protein
MELVQRHRDRIRSGDNSVIVRAADGTTVTGPINIDGGPFLIDGVPYNPMTDPEDLIKGGAGGVPERFPKGADGTYLRVNPTTHLLEWGVLPVDPGFANPMTTPNDIIVGGLAGLPTRMAKGSALQYLRVNAANNALEYGALPVDPGFANPMTTPGDIIEGASGGAPARRAKGAPSTVYAINAGGNNGYVQVTAAMVAANALTEAQLAAEAVHTQHTQVSHPGGTVVATGGLQTVPGSSLGLTTGVNTHAIYCAAMSRLSVTVNGTIVTMYLALNGGLQLEMGTFTCQAPGWYYTFTIASTHTAAASTGYTFSLQYTANAGSVAFSNGWTQVGERKR